MDGQLDLFGSTAPKPLAGYELRDWDWRDVRNARTAWNAATPDERLEWCKRWKINQGAIHKQIEMPPEG